MLRNMAPCKGNMQLNCHKELRLNSHGELLEMRYGQKFYHYTFNIWHGCHKLSPVPNEAFCGTWQKPCNISTKKELWSRNAYSRTGFQWVCRLELLTSFSPGFSPNLPLEVIAGDSAQHQMAKARCLHQIACVRRVRAEVGWLISKSRDVLGSPANCASTDAHSIFPG